MHRIHLLILTAICALFTVSCSEYCRKQVYLGGRWDSSLGECTLPGTTDENRLGDGAKDSCILSMLTRAFPYEGIVEYNRTVVIPDSFEGKRLTLVMERTKPSTLIVDGKVIGHLCHIFANHVYQLPAMCAGPHNIKILIDNSETSVPRQIFSSHSWTDNTQTNWNGILGNFYIEATDSTCITDVKVATDSRKADVSVSIVSNIEGNAVLIFKAGSIRKKVCAQLELGENVVCTTLDFGDDARTWSEFHPNLYDLDVSLKAAEYKDSRSTRFGLVDFRTDGSQFTVNGFRTFLRGKHDACVFPLTGHVPTDIEPWRRTFAKAREYGINHYRFHSWTPTEAAFQAADEYGIYLQCELPYWGAVTPRNSSLNEFLLNEGRMLIEQFGSHPSFVMMSLGNELGGSIPLMREWVEEFRRIDDNILYCFGSNNSIGWSGPQEGEDYYVGAKNRGSERFESHMRSSFAFCDATDGGYLNGDRPNTLYDYSYAVNNSPIPVIGHEIGQYQVYPDYSEISKYTGVLRPDNLSAFKDKMLATFGEDRSAEFQNITGNWALLCYRAEMEAALRTEGFGGFELLDLQDFPGQGTALVGVLDAFMEEKNIDNIKDWNLSCGPVVLLGRFADYCLNEGDSLRVGVQIANYLETDWTESLDWSICGMSGNFTVNVPQGSLATVGVICVPIEESGIQRLTLRSGDRSNWYDFHIYPTSVEDVSESLKEVSVELDSEIGGLFTPEFWNWGMFKGICEGNKSPVSPGTLSVDVSEEFRSLFDCAVHTDWQWWSILRNSRPAILDGRDDCTPIIEVIDNIERAHRLAILYRDGNGRLVSNVNLDAIAGTPEGDAFRKAVASLQSEH